MDATYHIIGDVHGNIAQLQALLRTLGYREPTGRIRHWTPPSGCQLVSVGDLVDRGPDSLACLHLVRHMVEAGHARLVLGNHEVKMMTLLRFLLGRGPAPRRMSIGRQMTWAQLLGCPREELVTMLSFLEATPYVLELDEGALVVAHARWEPAFRSLEGEQLEQACAFGRAPLDGPHGPREPTPSGNASERFVRLEPAAPLAERARWVRQYRGAPTVVWGHQIVRRGAVVQIGKTVNVESGCFQGHALSAWTWPTGEVTQASGAVSWRARLRPYLVASELIFPPSADDVAETLREWALRTVDEYFSWLEMALQERGAPPLFDALARTHARIYAQAETRLLRHSDDVASDPLDTDRQ